MLQTYLSWVSGDFQGSNTSSLAGSVNPNRYFGAGGEGRLSQDRLDVESVHLLPEGIPPHSPLSCCTISIKHVFR